MPHYETLILDISDNIAQVHLNRPQKANALNHQAWIELKSAFEFLDMAENVRVIILGGEGKHFCSGIDISLLQTITADEASCQARKREQLRKTIIALQASVSAIQICNKPVVASVSGGCIGAGLDIITACDIRYCSSDAFFTIKELDLGMVADLGTLQRLPRIIPEGIVRELAFTGRSVSGNEAERIGLVNKCVESRETLADIVYQLAATIASKSPVTIRGTKHVLNYSQDHSIADGLTYVATWNAAMLLSEDIGEAMKASIEKRDAIFKN